MKILALLTPAVGASPGAFAPHLLDEGRAVWAAYRGGTLREMYFQPEPVAVSLVFEAETHADVEAVLRSFPMVRARLLGVRLVTLGPWLHWNSSSTPPIVPEIPPSWRARQITTARVYRLG